MIVNRRELSNIFGVTERTISNWSENGLKYDIKDGKKVYDTAQAIKWYVEYKRPLEVDLENMSLDEADLRLKIARERNLQLDIQKKKGQLIDVDKVDEILSNVASIMINNLRQMVIRLPKNIQKKADNAIKDTIHKIKEEIQNWLSNSED